MRFDDVRLPLAGGLLLSASALTFGFASNWGSGSFGTAAPSAIAAAPSTAVVKRHDDDDRRALRPALKRPALAHIEAAQPVAAHPAAAHPAIAHLVFAHPTATHPIPATYASRPNACAAGVAARTARRCQRRLAGRSSADADFEVGAAEEARARRGRAETRGAFQPARTPTTRLHRAFLRQREDDRARRLRNAVCAGQWCCTSAPRSVRIAGSERAPLSYYSAAPDDDVYLAREERDGR